MLSGRTYKRFELDASGAEPNLADSMKSAGYERYHHGKRANSVPLTQEKFEINRY